MRLRAVPPSDAAPMAGMGAVQRISKPSGAEQPSTLRQQSEQLSATAAEVTGRGSQTDIVDEGGFGEVSTRHDERERMLALATHAATRMDEIKGALARLDAGRRPRRLHAWPPAIDPARLEALPRRRVLCVGCKGGAGLRG